MRCVRRKPVVLSFVALLLVAIVGVAAGGWYYSNVLKNDALVVDYTPSEPDLEVIAVGEGRVTLGVTDRTKSDGPWTKERRMASGGWSGTGATPRWARSSRSTTGRCSASSSWSRET